MVHDSAFGTLRWGFKSSQPHLNDISLAESRIHAHICEDGYTYIGKINLIHLNIIARIFLGKINMYLTVEREELRRFKKIIGFRHPKRKERLNKLIASL